MIDLDFHGKNEFIYVCTVHKWKERREKRKGLYGAGRRASGAVGPFELKFTLDEYT